MPTTTMPALSTQQASRITTPTPAASHHRHHPRHGASSAIKAPPVATRTTALTTTAGNGRCGGTTASQSQPQPQKPCDCVHHNFTKTMLLPAQEGGPSSHFTLAQSLTALTTIQQRAEAATTRFLVASAATGNGGLTKCVPGAAVPLGERTTSFHTGKYPEYQLARYAKAIADRSAFDGDVIAYGVALMLRAEAQLPHRELTAHVLHRLLVACIFVAHKMTWDRYYAPATYAKLVTFSTVEVARGERRLLRMLDWSVVVTRDDVEAALTRCGVEKVTGVLTPQLPLPAPATTTISEPTTTAAQRVARGDDVHAEADSDVSAPSSPARRRLVDALQYSTTSGAATLGSSASLLSATPLPSGSPSFASSADAMLASNDDAKPVA